MDFTNYKNVEKEIERSDLNEKEKELVINGIKEIKRRRSFNIIISFLLLGGGIIIADVLFGVSAVPSTLFDGNTGFFGTGGTNSYTPTQQLDVRGHGNFSGEAFLQNQSRVSIWLYNQTSAAGGAGTVTSVTRGEGFNGSGTSITTTGTLNINYTDIQRRVTGTCSAGSSIRIISETGTVTCETDDTGSGQLDDIFNGTVKSIITIGIINITSNDVTQNTTFTLRLSNESSLYLQLNKSTYDALVNESGSYAAIRFSYNQSQASFDQFGKFWYNMTDGNTGGVNGYNHTIEANRTMYVEYGKYWYNASDNSQLLFNYNQSYRFNQTIDLTNSYSIYWNNESGSYSPIKFGYNFTTPTFSMTNTWTAINTFNNVIILNNNITMDGGNQTFNYINQQSVFEGGNVTQGTNNTAFKICAWGACDTWYRP